MKTLLTLVLLSVLAHPAAASDTRELRVAVASNFVVAARELAEQFERQAGMRATVLAGATGKHYAQIVHGAPFDVLLAADSERPRRLEAEGHAVAGSRFTYARGVLVLWSSDPTFPADPVRLLRDASYQRLAIANPELAPYGLAAREALQSLGAWDVAQSRLVYGENVSQALQFAHSGNAQLALVALSLARPAGGSYWVVPQAHYQAIEQQAVQLSEDAAAGQFLAFLRSEAARDIIVRNGYGAPP